MNLWKNALKGLMYWYSLLKCDDSFNLVENMQKQEMSPLLNDINYVVSTFDE